MDSRDGVNVLFQGCVVFNNETELPEHLENFESVTGSCVCLEFFTREELIEIKNSFVGVCIEEITVTALLFSDDLENFSLLIEGLKNAGMSACFIVVDGIVIQGKYCEEGDGTSLTFVLKNLQEVDYVFYLQELPVDTIVENSSEDTLSVFLS